jgi:phage host-nuclease inhibitor protein Gam
MTKDLDEHEKTKKADRLMADLQRESMDLIWQTEMADSTSGAARAHYQAEMRKSEKRIASIKADIETLCRMN